jgi:ribosomal protein L11 methyltransferase
VLELTLRVAAAEVEEVLDAVLPALPGGLHARKEGDVAELTIADTPGTPAAEELRRLAGSSLIDLSTAEASDDWRQRRLARYEPLIVAERVLVRPDWAPPAGDPSLLEIVLEESSAFGTGVHPTTQACLTLLCTLKSGGSFADYGCGSGVLSIAAAKLGWSPVVAVDIEEASIDAVRRNAVRNEVAIEAQRIDVTSEPGPAAATVAANVPPDIHLGLAKALDQAPELAIVSGFKPDEAEAVASAWAAHGLEVEEQLQVREWTTLLLR